MCISVSDRSRTTALFGSIRSKVVEAQYLRSVTNIRCEYHAAGSGAGERRSTLTRTDDHRNFELALNPDFDSLADSADPEREKEVILEPLGVSADDLPVVGRDGRDSDLFSDWQRVDDGEFDLNDIE